MTKPYLAFALQTAAHGCRNRDDIKVNLDHVSKQIDGAMKTEAKKSMWKGLKVWWRNCHWFPHWVL